MSEEIKPPNISEETKLEMAKFFMKTSVPRILKQRAEERKLKKREEKD